MTAGASAPRKKSDLALRSVTGIALIGIALFCIVYGPKPFWVLLSVAGMIMIAEWASLIQAQRWQIWIAFLGMLTPLFLAMPNLNLAYAAPWCGLLVGTIVVLGGTRNVRLTAGMLYVGLPVLSLLYIHNQYDGIDLSFWTLAVVWATDIGAYFAGRSIGGPKLAPVWSPNKTWAGLIGGMISALVLGFALTLVLHVQIRLAAFAGLLAVAAQMGDLFESAMKRRAGVKDSGWMLPGHGGVMDRLDGAVPVSCIVALIVASGIY